MNADRPENGLEALAQVVSCESIIGWRSRGADGMDRGQTRVVLFLTDEQFHYSGEGRVCFHLMYMYIYCIHTCTIYYIHSILKVVITDCGLQTRLLVLFVCEQSMNHVCVQTEMKTLKLEYQIYVEE